MLHFSRRLSAKRSVSAEFLYLLMVVVAAALTAYWAAGAIGIDLSFIEHAASALSVDASATTPRQVANSQPRVEATPTSGAPHCRAGEQPAYLNGMAALHQQIGGAMGTPVECEHADGALGNTVQQTSAGLAAYDSQRNTETFTDGWHHWALTPNGLVAWEGTSAEPPPPATVDDAGDASDAVAASPEDDSSDAVSASPEDDSSAAVAAGNDESAAASEDGDSSPVVTDDDTGDQP